jgi:hypothetical protein
LKNCEYIIIVATHKKAEMPKDKCYFPLHVGCENNEYIGIAGDNVGDNISYKNSMYAELTGLYWAWKNLDFEYLGLVHYRRHFTIKNWMFRKTHKPTECIITDDELETILSPNKIIVPKKRNYYIETIASHYKHIIRDGEIHLTAARKILFDKYPDYLDAFDSVMNKTSAHMFNMFIMPKDLLNQYCTWLFSILAELETCIDISNYNAFEKRYIARVSEMLVNVWIIHNEIKTKTIGRIDLWNVSWIKKVTLFLAAKFFGYKYRKSL